MATEDMDVIELGTVSVDTQGGMMGIADTDLGWELHPGLKDD